VTFLAVTLVPACGLVWLGLKLLDQDSSLQAQRRRERAELAVVQRLSALERQLASRVGLRDLVEGGGVVGVEFGERGMDAQPKELLAWYPWAAEGARVDADRFEAGEELEFRRADYRGAESLYRDLARASDAAVRAGAQLRLARVLRKAGRAEQAMEAFGQLAEMGEVTIDGTPSSLLAARARCALLAELKRTEQLKREAEGLKADLRRGRWRVTSAVYQMHMQDARGWTGAGVDAESTGERLAAAVGDLWERWRGEALEGPTGRFVHPGRGGGVTVVWAQNAGGVRAVAMTDGFVSRLGSGSTLEEFSGRRRLLLAGLGLILVLVLAGSYFIVRSVAREMAAARLQTEFVSAVSHEFRTPLTSLRQFTEILAERRVPEERREEYYQALARATRRLHRLVEGLLDFGRMEAGAAAYRFAPLDLEVFVRATVEEFQAELEGRGYTVELRIEGGGEVNADRESMTRAFWNLLDNAVKYSPVNRTVWVDVESAEGRAAIHVRDRGLGVTPEEQAAILRKFVRGSASERVEGKGTGIGLAMVSHIVRAHGGELKIESRPGEGSTFTILLPLRS
jgi:signal transduction histidine kinase